MASGDYDRSLALLREFGVNSFSGCLLYDSVKRHQLTTVEGFTGYLEARSILVTLGEPVCHPLQYLDAAREFVEFARSRRKNVAFISVGQEFLEATRPLDNTWVFLGDDFIYDVATYAPRGNESKKVRSARNHFLKSRGRVVEIHSQDLRGTAVAEELQEIAQRWLRAKGAFQMHLLQLDVLKLASLKRYFYAENDDGPTAFLSCLPILGRQGFLYEDLIRHPSAPPGSTEALVLEALRSFRDEGFKMATFGLSPNVDPAQSNLSGASLWLTRIGVAMARRFSNLDTLYHYRKKYHTGLAEPQYLVKSPSGIGMGDLWGILDAFNLTPRRNGTPALSDTS